MVVDKLVTFSGGQTVSFKIENSGVDCFFVFGVRKSGSSILNNICHAMANHNKFRFVDVAGSIFDQNISPRVWGVDPAINEILTAGNVYGGFREMPAVFRSSEVYRTSRKVLLVRDPRDALVSEYFSNAYSHPIPVENHNGSEVSSEMMALRESALKTSLEQYVVDMAFSMNKTLLEYQILLDDPLVLTMKYEDVIFRKAALMRSVAGHFGWLAPDALINAVLSWADVVPSVEEQTSFVRQVKPGDHARKLPASTIQMLNAILKPSMDLFGYEGQ